MKKSQRTKKDQLTPGTLVVVNGIAAQLHWYLYLGRNSWLNIDGLFQMPRYRIVTEESDVWTPGLSLRSMYSQDVVILPNGAILA